MSRIEEAPGSRPPPLFLAGGALLLLSAGLAFRAIWLDPFVAADPQAFETWLFVPDRDSSALAVGVALAIAFLQARGARPALTPRVGAGTCLSAVLVLALQVGALERPILALPALTAWVVLVASSGFGRATARTWAIPLATLWLAHPLPGPWLSEVLWFLQQATGVLVELSLQMVGLDVERSGTELLYDGHAFVIIEACSGWRSIRILLVIGWLAGELCQLRVSRRLLVLAGVPLLGLVLNVLRVASIVLTQDGIAAEAFENHTTQGLVVLAVGSIATYALAARLARVGADDDEASSASPAKGRPLSAGRWLAAVTTLTVTLAAISMWPAGERPRITGEDLSWIPLERGTWRGERLGVDYFFPYETSLHRQFRASYRTNRAETLRRKQSGLVDLLVAWERAGLGRSNRLPRSKLLRPASDWTVVDEESIRIWGLDTTGWRAVLQRRGGEAAALVVAWRARDRGAFVEGLEELAGVDPCAGRLVGCARSVVRLAIEMPADTPAERLRASRTADRFVREHRDWLSRLVD